ncbi:MAG: mannose-1-phosphate guanylyltransferase/mannose-6-phosphate isomerase [Pseudomonadota bacterium]
MRKIWPIILSGGSGSRLWPVSRASHPKQLLALADAERTMLQQTVARVADRRRFHKAILVAGDEHRFLIAEQLRAIGYDAQAIVLEPAGRNTAPAIALGALAARAAEEDAILLVMPSDHVIGDGKAFLDAVEAAALAVVRHDRLVTFGIKPDRPETGYGYIEAGPAEPGVAGCQRVARFVEKPDRETAQAYFESGVFLWNSGMFLFRAARYLAELERHAPAILEACRNAMASATAELDFLRPDRAAFLASPADSIDFAVMEKTRHASVVPAAMRWSDVGSWSALWEVSAKDAKGNACKGDILTHEVSNSLLYSDGPALAAIGLDKAIVVATPDAVLVAAQERAQDVKAIIEQLKAGNRREHLSHLTVHRPWGSCQITDSGPGFQTRRLVVNPGGKRSPRRHDHHAAHWIVIKGTARVTRGEATIAVHENESVFIPRGTLHGLENPGQTPLHIVELRSGAALDEALDGHHGKG